jgi:hypothetical protein
VAADGNQLYPSRQVAVGLMIRSWGALQCMSSALLRSPHGLQQEGLRSIIGTAVVAAPEKRNLAIDQWGGDKRSFQDVDTPAGRNGVTVVVKMVESRVESINPRSLNFEDAAVGVPPDSRDPGPLRWSLVGISHLPLSS